MRLDLTSSNPLKVGRNIPKSTVVVVVVVVVVAVVAGATVKCTHSSLGQNWVLDVTAAAAVVCSFYGLRRAPAGPGLGSRKSALLGPRSS